MNLDQPVHINSGALLVWPNVLSVLVPEDQSRPNLGLRQDDDVPETVIFPGMYVPVRVRYRNDVEILQDVNIVNAIASLRTDAGSRSNPTRTTTQSLRFHRRPMRV